MRRFIVGLLATVGFFTLLSIVGAIAFAIYGPLASKPLPSLDGAVARPAHGAARDRRRPTC